MHRATFLLIVVFLIALAACTPQSTTSPLNTPLSSPLSQESAPQEIIPTPLPGKAVICGRLHLTTPTVLVGELYLGQAVPTTDPNIELISLDEQNAPKAQIDRETWEFIFTNVDPGRYGIIVWEPTNSSPIDDPKTGETLFIDVSPNSTINVGTLYFPSPAHTEDAP